MRLLFLETCPIWIHGLPNGFRDLGHEAATLHPWPEEVVGSLIDDYRPELIFTMGWTPDNAGWAAQEAIVRHVRRAGVPHIFWATEDPTHTAAFSLPYVQHVRPDIVFTVSPACVPVYERLGCKAAHLGFGFHPAACGDAYAGRDYAYSVALVANAYPGVLSAYPKHYRLESLGVLLQPLLEAGIPVDIWGSEWESMAPYVGPGISDACLHGHLEYVKAGDLYRSSVINLGLQNHPGQLTQRTYEILGSGGFLLAQDTPGIRSVFEPGRDLAVSSSPEQTLDLVRYYLNHPGEAGRIALQGRQAVEEHSYRRRAVYIMRRLYQWGIIRPGRKFGAAAANRAAGRGEPAGFGTGGPCPTRRISPSTGILFPGGRRRSTAGPRPSAGRCRWHAGARSRQGEPRQARAGRWLQSPVEPNRLGRSTTERAGSRVL